MIMIAQGYFEQVDVLVVKLVWQTENRCSCGHADQILRTAMWWCRATFLLGMGCRTHQLWRHWVMLWLMYAWNFCGALLYFPFLWLYQEVLIAQEVVKLIILVILGILQSVTSLAHLFAQKTTAVLLAFSAGIEVSVLTVLSLRGKKKCKKRRSKHFRGRSWSDLPICFFILHWMWNWVSVLISRFCGD